MLTRPRIMVALEHCRQAEGSVSHNSHDGDHLDPEDTAAVSVAGEHERREDVGRGQTPDDAAALYPRTEPSRALLPSVALGA